MANRIPGQVVRVIDGDTLDILKNDNAKQRIRLAEIDAPESCQPSGYASWASLSGLVMNQPVFIEQLDVDQYGRIVGHVFGDYFSGSASAYQVANGMAWVYDAYATDPQLDALEQTARSVQIGLWADPAPIPPWDWRHDGYSCAEEPIHPWVIVKGDVKLSNGAPVCALVLANGQYGFSCDGAGSYNLVVPTDQNNQITLFAFADGFAPFSVTSDESGFPYHVQVEFARAEDPAIQLAGTVQCTDTPDRVRLQGDLDTPSGAPICAMVLANGQQMFSCDDNLGRYDLTVPLDANGEVTLFAFAAGFRQYSATVSGASCTR